MLFTFNCGTGLIIVAQKYYAEQIADKISQ